MHCCFHNAIMLCVTVRSFKPHHAMPCTICTYQMMTGLRHSIWSHHRANLCSLTTLTQVAGIEMPHRSVQLRYMHAAPHRFTGTC